MVVLSPRFQFLGIPPKGEHAQLEEIRQSEEYRKFPISRDPPEGGTGLSRNSIGIRWMAKFPISRDPPEGGTSFYKEWSRLMITFPISRDPPEGGTVPIHPTLPQGQPGYVSNF